MTKRSLPTGLLSTLAVLCAASVLSGCDPDFLPSIPDILEKVGDSGDPSPSDRADWSHDILKTSLHFDLESMQGSAEVTTRVRPGARVVSFEVGDLSELVVLHRGRELPYLRDETHLHVLRPRGWSRELTFSFRYRFSEQEKWNGLLNSGLTLLWPYHCGNLFPCKSDPADGSVFEIDVVGNSQTLVYPRSIPVSSPAYQVAWAEGDFTEIDLGTTEQGTKVSVWYLPRSESDARKGTANLVQYVNWLEQSYGQYLYGDHVGSVQADWGPGALGGMEHHPYWHVATDAMSDASVHAHEAVHGWFGDGVRIQCWGSFLLSEGTTSYLAARLLGIFDGPEAEQAVWDDYDARLVEALEDNEVKTAWHRECPQIDILDGYFNRIPYAKGAFFFRALERSIGTQAMDLSLRSFYQIHRGRSATFEDLLRLIHLMTGYNPDSCAEIWLLQDEVPDLEASCTQLTSR